MKFQITRISVLQSSKIVVALYILFGLIYSLIGIPLFFFGGKDMQIMAVIYLLMPVLMAVLGFIFFSIFALLYNLLARFLGGVEFESKEIH